MESFSALHVAHPRRSRGEAFRPLPASSLAQSALREGCHPASFLIDTRCRQRAAHLIENKTTCHSLIDTEFARPANAHRVTAVIPNPFRGEGSLFVCRVRQAVSRRGVPHP